MPQSWAASEVSGACRGCDGVSEDKPAQKAGLQKGDVVVRLGDSTVTDMMSYMRALSVFKQGDSTQATIERGAESLEFRIDF